jgi:hypothetical protein
MKVAPTISNVAIPALVAFLASSAPVVCTAAAEPPQLAAIDPRISFAVSGGAWESAGGRGRYRAVVETLCSAEHCRDRLFVQWLSEGSAAGVAFTRFISEVGDLTHITRVRFVYARRGTRLEVLHEQDADGLRWTRCLRLRADGKYVHQEGACRRGT